MSAAPATGRTPRATADRHLTHYLDILGLQPGASHEDVATAYFLRRNELSRDPSEEGERRLLEVDHAFRIVKSRYKVRRDKVIKRQINRFLVSAVSVLAILTLISWFQFAERLRPYFNEFEPGEAVYRYEDNSLFGEVLAFDDDHAFPAGPRQDAYLIRLHPSGPEAWISAHTARQALRAR